ncbi:MAG: DUF58 domain-containing protein [Pseudohongiellaceae bacterium]
MTSGDSSLFPRLTFRPGDSVVLKQLRTLLGLFPLTLQGSIILVVAATALSVFGYGAMDLVVFALAVCALVILVFCLFCAVVCGILVQRQVHRELENGPEIVPRLNAEAGFPNESGFTLTELKWLPLIRLSWEIEFPDHIQTRVRHGAGRVLEEEIIPERRCLTQELRRRFTVADVLGLCRYSWHQSQRADCCVLPRIHSLKSLPLLRSLTAEDGIPNPGGEPEGDRMEIRRYAPGDSVRNIMWKVYARTRQLNVRLPERSVMHSQRTLAYLLSSPRDEAAAAVARMALERGALGEIWQFGADGSAEPCSELQPALRAVAGSRALQGRHPYGLDDFLAQTGAPKGVHCILFAAAERADWLPRLRATIAGLSGQVSLVLATDGVDEESRPSFWPSLWQKVLFTGRAQAARAMGGSVGKAELLGLLTDVGQLVESVVVIDRRSGVSYDRQLRKV